MYMPWTHSSCGCWTIPYLPLGCVLNVPHSGSTEMPLSLVCIVHPEEEAGFRAGGTWCAPYSLHPGPPAKALSHTTHNFTCNFYAKNIHHDIFNTQIQPRSRPLPKQHFRQGDFLFFFSCSVFPLHPDRCLSVLDFPLFSRTSLALFVHLPVYLIPIS